MKRFTIFVLLIAALLAACGPAATPVPTAVPPTAVPPTALPTDTPIPPTATPAPVTLNVYAAASLTGSFTEIGKNFQTANPSVTVTLNFAGSQALGTQIQQGAPADVFASADHKNMDALVTANLAPTPYQDFATNLLVVILPPNNPASLQTLAGPGQARPETHPGR